MTATLIYPIGGGYKRLVNRPAASAVAKASGEGVFPSCEGGGGGGGRADRICLEPLHLLALPSVKVVRQAPICEI